jgi:hypothetical protein
MSYRDSYLSHVPVEQARAVVLQGATAAAILASGIGCAALGIFVTLADASATAKELMTLSTAVGPLSGKTTFAVVVWLISGGLLHVLWRGKPVYLTRTYKAVFLGLLLIGLLGTFPPFYVLVAEMFH